MTDVLGEPMRVGYLLDEHVVPLAGGRRLFLWARNRSSHRAPEPYFRRLHDVAAGEAADWVPLTTVPPPMPGLPNRLITGAWGTPGGERVLVQFMVQSPTNRLRVLDAACGAIVADQELDGWSAWAIDPAGRLAFATEQPRHARWRVLDLDAGLAPVAEGALPEGAFFAGAAAWQGGRWWVALKEGRKHVVLGLDPAGTTPPAALPIDRQAGGLATDTQGHLAVGVGPERVRVWDAPDQKPIDLKPFPKADKRGLVEVALAPDGRWLLAANRFAGELVAYDLAGREEVARLPFAHRQDALAPGEALFRNPGFAAVDDGWWTALDGVPTFHPAPITNL